MTGWTDQTSVTDHRDDQHRAGFRLRAGVRAAVDGGVPDAAEPSAHRRHLDADADAQRRLVDRHLGGDRAADLGHAAAHAVLAEHVTPFNHALQMPNVTGTIDMATDTGRAMMDAIVTLQAQIIAFSHDYQMVMMFTACAIPLAIMIGSTKAALRKQSQAPEHAVIE